MYEDYENLASLTTKELIARRAESRRKAKEMRSELHKLYRRLGTDFGVDGTDAEADSLRGWASTYDSAASAYNEEIVKRRKPKKIRKLDIRPGVRVSYRGRDYGMHRGTVRSGLYMGAYDVERDAIYGYGPYQDKVLPSQIKEILPPRASGMGGKRRKAKSSDLPMPLGGNVYAAERYIKGIMNPKARAYGKAYLHSLLNEGGKYPKRSECNLSTGGAEAIRQRIYRLVYANDSDLGFGSGKRRHHGGSKQPKRDYTWKCSRCGEQAHSSEFRRKYGVPRCPNCNDIEVGPIDKGVGGGKRRHGGSYVNRDQVGSAAKYATDVVLGERESTEPISPRRSKVHEAAYSAAAKAFDEGRAGDATDDAIEKARLELNALLRK